MMIHITVSSTRSSQKTYTTIFILWKFQPTFFYCKNKTFYIKNEFLFFGERKEGRDQTQWTHKTTARGDFFFLDYFFLAESFRPSDSELLNKIWNWPCTVSFEDRARRVYNFVCTFLMSSRENILRFNSNSSRNVYEVEEWDINVWPWHWDFHFSSSTFL